MVSRIAKTSFGVYLLHSFFYPFIGVEKQVTGSLFLIPFHVMASCVVIYLVASIVYQVYRLTIGKIILSISKTFFDRIAYKI